MCMLSHVQHSHTNVAHDHSLACASYENAGNERVPMLSQGWAWRATNGGTPSGVTWSGRLYFHMEP
jgi:hypothetical protein